MVVTLENTNVTSRIFFGSCSSQYYEQPFWNIIKERNPTAFVWGGDAIYADDQKREAWSDEDPAPWLPSILKDRRRSRKIAYATPEYIRKMYSKQLQVKDYQQLLQENIMAGEKISIFGAIDDHDYGINNGDVTFPYRRQSGIEFTKFLGLKNESSAMARRAAEGLGVYGVQVYDFSSTTRRLLTDDEAGLDPDVVPAQSFSHRSKDHDETSNQLVAVFVLDVRSNKTPWAKRIPERFTLQKGDFLGEHQWEWFETAIGRSNASVNIIVSGIQVHAPWFYDANIIENWSGFPKAQHRLYQTILQSNVRAPIIVSGDVHFSQLLRKDCRKMMAASKPKTASYQIVRPLYEVTTSGMTHSWGSKASSYCGRPNKSRLCTFYPFRVLVKAVMIYAHFVSPWTALLQDDSSAGIAGGHFGLKYSLDRNVAEFDFDWVQKLVTVRILGDEGQILIREDWSMDQLTASADTMLNDKAFELGQQRLESFFNTTFPDNHGEYVCVNYRGNINRAHFAFSVFSTIFIFMMAGMSPIVLCLYFLGKIFHIRKHNINNRQRNDETGTMRPKKE